VNLERDHSPQSAPKPVSQNTVFALFLVDILQSSASKFKSATILLLLAALASMLFIWHDVLQALHAGSRLSNEVNFEQYSRELTAAPPPTSAVQTTITTVVYTTSTTTTTTTIILLDTQAATIEEPSRHSADIPSTAIRIAMALLLPISILTCSSLISSRLVTPSPSDPAIFDESLDMAPSPPLPSFAAEPVLEKQPITTLDPSDEKWLSPSAALQRPVGPALPTASDMRVGEGRADDSCLDALQMNSPGCQPPPNRSSSTPDEHCQFTDDALAGDRRGDNSYSDSDPGNTSPDIQKALGNINEGLGMGLRQLEESFGLAPVQDEEIIIDPNPDLDNVKRFALAHKSLVDMNDRQEEWLKEAQEFTRAAIEYNKNSLHGKRACTGSRKIDIPQIKNFL